MAKNIALSNQNALILALENSELYPHRVDDFQLIETHISWVLLTGKFAYKIKKPFNLGFVDYSTLEKRYFYYEEELQLNRILSPALYIEVVPIYGTINAPSFQKKGNIIEYALKMHQFPQDTKLSYLISKNLLTKDMIQESAETISSFHQKAIQDTIQTPLGNCHHVFNPVIDNFKDIKSLLQKDNFIDKKLLLKRLNKIKTWSIHQFEDKQKLFEYRKANGFIRDCHGDLHLNNIIFFQNQIMIFDRIEFNPEFRWIDIMNEIAFLIMDVELHQKSDLASIFLNHYLTKMGDFAGLGCLDFYKVYRAMVRAKVTLITPSFLISDFTKYLEYAENIIKKKKPLLMITSGFSGSGKTSLAASIAASWPAIHIRSDIERKRLYPDCQDKALLYSKEKSFATYQRLYDIAESLIKSGYSVIVDATFLQKNSRALFYQLSKKLKAHFIILNTDAPYKILSERIQNRKTKQKSESDADVEVLNQQLLKQELFTKKELNHTISVSNVGDFDVDILLGKIRNFIEVY